MKAIANTSPEAVALREAALEWVRASDADAPMTSDAADRRCDRANGSLLRAAIIYAKAVAKVGERIRRAKGDR